VLLGHGDAEPAERTELSPEGREVRALLLERGPPHVPAGDVVEDVTGGGAQVLVVGGDPDPHVLPTWPRDHSP
jgi:hypothetical protein